MTIDDHGGAPTRIRVANALTAEEDERLFRWSADPFEMRAHGLTWRSKDVHVILDADRQPVSHVGLLRHDVHLGRELVCLAGVGAVVTRPEAQGRGYARRLLAEAMDYAAETWQPAAALLFCRPALTTFYTPLGWSIVSGPVTIVQPAGPVVSPFPVMVRPLMRDDWPAGPLDLESLPW